MIVDTTEINLSDTLTMSSASIYRRWQIKITYELKVLKNELYVFVTIVKNSYRQKLHMAGFAVATI
jgi:hypothetical protein